MADDLTSTIRDNAATPAEVSIDGQSVKQHSLRDQIEADRYVSSKQATKNKLGIRITRVSSPGGV